MEFDNVIGYLASYNKGWIVICQDCKPQSSYVCDVPVYHENIGDYQQHCGSCNKLLHEPKTPSWPELFDGKGN